MLRLVFPNLMSSASKFTLFFILDFLIMISTCNDALTVGFWSLNHIVNDVTYLYILTLFHNSWHFWLWYSCSVSTVGILFYPSQMLGAFFVDYVFSLFVFLYFSFTYLLWGCIFVVTLMLMMFCWNVCTLVKTEKCQLLWNRSSTSLSSNKRRAKKESSHMHCASP
jgi:hypothetical protein